MNEKTVFLKRRASMLKAIKRDLLSRDEYALATFLQGSVNKKFERSIIIDVDIYLDYVNEPYEFCDFWSIVDVYKKYFDGLAVYDLDADDVGINLAATVCACEGLLGVPRTLLHHFEGMPVRFDAADIAGSRAERQNEIFERYRARLDRGGLVHQVVLGDDYHLELRDFAIYKGYFTFFTDCETPEDLAFRDKVLRWARRNIAIYGWTTNEIAFLKNISAYGNYVVPMDWSANHSYFSRESVARGGLKQKKRKLTPLTAGKHYLAIVVSDGDNVQWLERDFATTSTYGQRMDSPKNYKMNWTVSPSMATLCPDVLQGLYDRGKDDYFITGVSGVGYTNLMTYPSEHFDTYAQLTADAMERCGLREMCMLDNMGMLEDAEETHRRLDILASHDIVRGAIWELDPDRYGSGRGRVLFSSNGKPFLSVRLSLWHPSNRPGNITREWLDEYAKEINSYPVSPNTIDGYTVLNIHPWTVKVEDIDYLVSRLDKHIELVYVKDMLDAVTRFVPHEDAAPSK